MNKTIKALGKICDERRLDEKLLFVPSYSIGHQIGEHLAKEGGAWINLRVTTPTGYAQELILPELSSASVRLIESQERLAIVEKLYRDGAISSSSGRYFEGAEEIPGILKTLTSTLHELRMEGIRLDSSAFIVNKKGDELKTLLTSFDRYLRERRLIDQAGLLRMAIEKLKKSEYSRKGRVVMVLSDSPYPKLEKELIGLVGGKDLVILPHSRPLGLSIPGRFFDPSGTVDGLSPPKSDIELLPWLFRPEQAQGPFNDGSVLMFHALGESNEVREVFRRMFKDGVPLDDTEILVTTLDPYVSMIYELAASLDIPVRFSSGIPITYARPGRALVYYLRWQAENFSATYLMRLLSGGYLDFDRTKLEGEKPSPRRAAAMIRESSIGWGRERYASRLKALSESYRSKAEEHREEGEDEKAKAAERTASQVEWVAKFTEEMMSSIPIPSHDGIVSSRDLFIGAREFLNKYCRTAEEMEAAAKVELNEILELMIQGPALSETADRAAERLIEMIEKSSVGFASPKPGYLHVAHYRSGGHSGRSHTFVLGLDQTKFPGVLLQDPVILDVERKRLGDELVLAGEHISENIYAFAKVLGSLKGSVTLSYPCRDLKENRELFPSSVLLNVYRLLSDHRDADYGALMDFLGVPVGFIPKGDSVPLGDLEWWLGQKGSGYQTDSVHGNYPHLLNGDKAEAQRDSETLNEYDGLIPSSAGTMDPLGSGMVLSPTRLESLATCPYAFFVHHVLGIEPLEVMEEDRGRWLDALQKGSLLHEVFRRFMEEVTAKGKRPTMKDLALLEAIAQEEIEHWKEKVPISSSLSFNREVEDITQALRMFLNDEEERRQKVEPCFFELSFGMPKKEKNGVSTEEPVEIRMKGNGSFKLRGQIDRIDRCGSHEYEIWDYKTGGTWGYGEGGYVNKGRQLQPALYAKAAETLLRKGVDKQAKVVRAGYYFPTPKGDGLRLERTEPIRDALYVTLEDLFELLRKSIFPTSWDKDSCKFCKFDRACGGVDAATARTKKKLNKDERLKPIVRLKEYA
jgi:hypothetical protein